MVAVQGWLRTACVVRRPVCELEQVVHKPRIGIVELPDEEGRVQRPVVRRNEHRDTERRAVSTERHTGSYGSGCVVPPGNAKRANNRNRPLPPSWPRQIMAA